MVSPRRNSHKKKTRTIRSVSSERGADWFPVHEQVTSDHADVLPLGEDIKCSRFSRTARAHQSRQRPRLDIPMNIAQETPGAARYGDHVVDPFPGESLTIWERPLLPWDTNILDLLPGSLPFLKCFVQNFGLMAFPPEDRNICLSVGALENRLDPLKSLELRDKLTLRYSMRIT